MRKVLYRIPYFYDEADDSYPIKYCNDLPCSFGVVGAIREREDGTPIDADVEVEAEEGVHAILATYPDVWAIRDPA